MSGINATRVGSESQLRPPAEKDRHRVLRIELPIKDPNKTVIHWENLMRAVSVELVKQLKSGDSWGIVRSSQGSQIAEWALLNHPGVTD